MNGCGQKKKGCWTGSTGSHGWLTLDRATRQVLQHPALSQNLTSIQAQASSDWLTSSPLPTQGEKEARRLPPWTPAICVLDGFNTRRPYRHILLPAY